MIFFAMVYIQLFVFLRVKIILVATIYDCLTTGMKKARTRYGLLCILWALGIIGQ